MIVVAPDRDTIAVMAVRECVNDERGVFLARGILLPVVIVECVADVVVVVARTCTETLSMRTKHR